MSCVGGSCLCWSLSSCLLLDSAGVNMTFNHQSGDFRSVFPSRFVPNAIMSSSILLGIYPSGNGTGTSTVTQCLQSTESPSCFQTPGLRSQIVALAVHHPKAPKRLLNASRRDVYRNLNLSRIMFETGSRPRTPTSDTLDKYKDRPSSTLRTSSRIALGGRLTRRRANNANKVPGTRTQRA